MNFNNPFGENLIHNMRLTIKKVKDEWEQCWHLG